MHTQQVLVVEVFSQEAAERRARGEPDDFSTLTVLADELKDVKSATLLVGVTSTYRQTEQGSTPETRVFRAASPVPLPMHTAL